MLIFTENAEIWEKLFAFLFDNFLFIFDVIWKTNIPLTDITIAYWLIFWMIIKLSIFAINGTSTGYNDITNQVSAGARSVTKSYSTAAKKYNKNKQNKEKRANAPVKKFTPNAKRPMVNKNGERINNND